MKRMIFYLLVLLAWCLPVVAAQVQLDQVTDIDGNPGLTHGDVRQTVNQHAVDANANFDELYARAKARGKAWNILEEYDQGDIATDPATLKVYISKVNGNIGNTFASTESWQEIESGAGTMSDAAVKVAYENNPNTNAYTDADQAAVAALGTAATRAASDTFTNDSSLISGAGIKTYGDANWGGGTFIDAPSDGEVYGRENGTWSEIGKLTPGAGITITPSGSDAAISVTSNTYQPSDADLSIAAGADTAGAAKYFGSNGAGVVGFYELATVQGADPDSDSEAGKYYGATGTGHFFYKSEGGLFDISAGTYTPDAGAYPLTLGVGSGGTVTINSVDYTATGSPYTIDNLFGAVQMAVTYDGSNDTTTWSGTDSADVGGTSPNFSITMDAAKSLAAAFSETGSPTILFADTFDSTGYDEAAWVEILGDPDEDYTTTPAPLSGTQSLYLGARANTADQEAYIPLSPTSGKTTVVNFSLHCTDLPSSAGDTRLMTFETNTAERGYLRIENGDTSPTLTVQASGGTKVSTVNALSEDTTYHVWVEWKNGTGANALTSVGFDTVDTRPTSGDGYAESSDGTNTIEVNRLDLGGSNSYGTATLSYNCIIDDFKYWEED